MPPPLSQPSVMLPASDSISGAPQAPTHRKPPSSTTPPTTEVRGARQREHILMNAVREWWRPISSAGVGVEVLNSSPPRVPASSLAFGALIVFTLILLLAPQAHFAVLVPLRIALWPVLVACGAYVFGCVSHGRPVIVWTRELKLAAWLAGWAVLTVPLSLWPGGSIDVLQGQYLKTLVVFWLLASLV